MANVEDFNEHRLKKHLDQAVEMVRTPKEDDELFDQMTDGGDRRKVERRKAFASYIENDRRGRKDRRGPCEDRRETKAGVEDTPS